MSKDLLALGTLKRSDGDDISITNMVESNRVADAQLGYLSPGPLGKPKQGIISKILGGLWP